MTAAAQQIASRLTVGGQFAFQAGMFLGWPGDMVFASAAVCGPAFTTGFAKVVIVAEGAEVRVGMVIAAPLVVNLVGGKIASDAAL